MLPLQGIRVIDWTNFQMGPVCSLMLADLGAEVIKLEQLVIGDGARGAMTTLGQNIRIGNLSYYFECMNRNKKSLAINLKQEEGREAVRRLVEKSDVFVQNFRPGLAEKLGMDYETLRQRNPRLIYATGSGVGPEGPDAYRPAYDGIGQARSGFIKAATPLGLPPQPIASGMIDQVSGLTLAFGIVVAICARERLGIGQKVDASLLGSAIWMQGLAVSTTLMFGAEQPKFRREDTGNPLYNCYECADGRWIFFAMVRSDKYWHDFCAALGIQHFEHDARFRDMNVRTDNKHALIQLIDETMAQKTSVDWLERLRPFTILIYDVINGLADLASDPQVVANGYVVDFDHPTLGRIKVPANPVRFSATPGDVRMPAPELGQHTEEILVELCGYNWDQIGQLRERGVI